MKTRVQNLFLALALLAGIHQAAAQSTNFVLASTVSGVSNPSSLVLADVNGDGTTKTVTNSVPNVA